MAARKKFVCGNWKMYGSRIESGELLLQLKEGWKKEFDEVEVAVCPPFTLLPLANEHLADTRIGLGAQNCHYEVKGAFTGEISAAMLAEAECLYVILGHSERRTLFGESDEMVSRKLAAALQAELRPIVCIGETLEERESGKTEEVLARQLAGSLATISGLATPTLTIAYEPVWAIGTGRTATPQQAQEAHAFIRETLRPSMGTGADDLRILYGGSVKPENARELFSQPDIDGGLIGGASLVAESFLSIIQAAV